ncbi:hypothetical protein HJC23_006516 [Cyclotella cryptica]|uniref:Sepiapterin reductase n=1 Tax=Cyclotella cryptica TaxID=29204 RepID=A0ABD3P0C5_9STRA|eukprot:CCRYP_018569-RA/>CCRYP_018569-RA protein AED:0.02 eAED:0.01 QI:0/-1/0/1/-1/1/1/0/321
MENTKSRDTRKSLIVLTGASRGIGRSIALSIADACCVESSTDAINTIFPLPVHLVLIARSLEALEETARLVRERCNYGCGDEALPKITTSCYPVDLSDLESLPNKIQQVFDTLAPLHYDRCWLFSNAGSVEPLGATPSLTKGNSSLAMNQLRAAVDLNITSVMWLSSMFARTFSPPSDTKSHNYPSIRIINMSSLCAIQPFPTMAPYCAGKAARDMFHSVLAKEMSDGSDEGNQEGTSDGCPSNRKSSVFKVLNYAPGACDTMMTDVLADCSSLDLDLHNYFANSKKENTLINPADSARKLIGILTKDEYESGSHVDYWDA